MEYVRGLDVSKYQTVDINWELLRREGYRFVFLRASGPDKARDWTHLEKDPHFDTHYERAGNAGFVRGAYHYLLPDLRRQAAFFIESVGNKPLDASYWGDVEQNGLTVEKCEAFFDALDRHVARMAGIYTRASFLNRIGAERSEIITMKGQRPLWVAHHDASQPTLPSGWNTWQFWQYAVAARGTVPSIPQRVDLNYYNGNLAQFLVEFEPGSAVEIREQLQVIEDAVARIRALFH
jgi:GH25 family lysozyme M1 (1,4-beta-N-acetylmuramidase)